MNHQAPLIIVVVGRKSIISNGGGGGGVKRECYYNQAYIKKNNCGTIEGSEPPKWLTDVSIVWYR